MCIMSAVFCNCSDFGKAPRLVTSSSPTEEAGEHQTIYENEPRQGKYIFVSLDSIK